MDGKEAGAETNLHCMPHSVAALALHETASSTGVLQSLRPGAGMPWELELETTATLPSPTSTAALAERGSYQNQHSNVRERADLQQVQLQPQISDTHVYLRCSL